MLLLLLADGLAGMAGDSSLLLLLVLEEEHVVGVRSLLACGKLDWWLEFELRFRVRARDYP